MLPVLIGAAIVLTLFPEFARKGTGWLFTGCIGIGAGLAITSSTAFWWLAAFGQPDLKYLIFELGLFVILALAAAIRIWQNANLTHNRSPWRATQSPDNNRGLMYAFILLLVAFIAAFMLKAVFERPDGAHDAWAIWNYRARWLFRGGSHWTHAFTYLNPADSPDYPLLVTGSVFRIWNMVGTDHIFAPITVAGVLAVGSVLVVFAGLSVLRGLNQGCLAAIFLLMATQFMNVATYQYGDAPLAFFILSTIILFSLHDHYPDLAERLLLLAGLTAACAAWTKNEGILFLVLVIISRFMGRIRRDNIPGVLKQLLYFTIGMSPILLSLILFKVYYAIANDLVNQANLIKLSDYLVDFNRYTTLLLGIGAKILTFNDSIFILSIAYLIFSGIDRSACVKEGVKSHLWIIALMLGGYFCSFFISPHNLEWHMGSSLRRLIVQLWPTWVFVCFYCAKGPERRLRTQTE
jgi:hypothetical protein